MVPRTSGFLNMEHLILSAIFLFPEQLYFLLTTYRRTICMFAEKFLNSLCHSGNLRLNANHTKPIFQLQLISVTADQFVFDMFEEISKLLMGKMGGNVVIDILCALVDLDKWYQHMVAYSH